MLRPLGRVESGINKPPKYQESLSKEVIFLEVISFDVEMQLPALKGQLSPVNGLKGILLPGESVEDRKYHLGKLLLQC